MKIDLNSDWTMTFKDNSYPCSVPCSVYDTLMKAGAIKDPYYRNNELTSTVISDEDVVFSKEFSLPDKMLTKDRLALTFEGIDTLADVFLNDTHLGSCDNMHRTYEFDVRGIADYKNLLLVVIHSPTAYIRQAQKERPLTGVKEAMEGYPHLRKAHYMFGWDWGMKLPDMGIWRGVSINGYSGGRIRGVYYSQVHTDGKVAITCTADFDIWANGVTAQVIFTSPENVCLKSAMTNGKLIIEVNDPQLWWVRGLGEQPMYISEVRLMAGGEVLDSRTDRIGLRTLTVSQDTDKWGREFCFVNNGVKVFAMGANIVPEDQILPKCTKERTTRMLRDCLAANFNFVRVWGGGYYPDNDFYDFCDEHGLIVWQDFMFACSAYLLTNEFEATVRAEVSDNVKRLRNHPSLGMWCGNNEIESAWEYWGWPVDKEARADYLRLFEEIIPNELILLDYQRFYWPSSPSSGGGFKEPSSNKAGDMHYWAVWHDFKPFGDFKKLYYRFCSEYGFESLPDMKTIMSFADPRKRDLDLSSPVMKTHQKCDRGMDKLKFYLGQIFGNSAGKDFERTVYQSQLVQADCIRSNVEHMRRARGRCMGSAYWQMNDADPVISWSSVDYYGRWKALHYYARKFYAPLLLSCDDREPTRPHLYVTNDTANEEPLTVICRIRDNRANILEEFKEEIVSEPLSSVCAMKLDLSKYLLTSVERQSRYIEYVLISDGSEVSSGTTMFVPPKDFRFLHPGIHTEIDEQEKWFEVRLSADCFVKGVALSLTHTDTLFSDNWFDIHGGKQVAVRIPKQPGLTLDSVMTQLRYHTC